MQIKSWFYFYIYERWLNIMAKVSYIRVSSQEQSEQRQIEAMKKHGIEKWFIEKISAKNTNRPQLKAMLEYVREGDIVYIHDFSRLARNTADLLKLVEDFSNRGITLISNKENLDTSTPTGKLMLTVIGAIYEFERAILLERQREGIALAVRAGKYKGRKAVEIQDFTAHYERYLKREVNKTQLAKDLCVSRPTLDKLIRENENNK